MKYHTLDIGCGNRARGDVNLDLFPEKSKHRGDTAINIKAIRNFIIGDAHYLPFRTKGFHTVYSHHLIEHLDNPIRFLKECIRVASRKVIIILPHRYNPKQTSHKLKQIHVNFFSVKWFDRVLRNFERDIQIIYKPLPFKFGFVLWMSEIEVTIFL